MKVSGQYFTTPLYSGKGVSAEGNSQNYRIHAIVQYLLGRGNKIESGSMSSKLIRAVLLSEDPEVLQAMRDEFRGVLKGCAEILPLKSDGGEKLFEAFVGNVVALLPYSYPLEGEQFQIPVKVGGRWKMATYTVDRKIKLTPEWFSKSIVAYGLTSQDGPPLLTFLGTTFPAGEGFVATILADCTPGMSVGHGPYLFGKKKLIAWMEGKKGIQLYGMSLGGSLAFQVLRNHRENVGRVFAYSPAGLYSWNWGKERFDQGAEVQIFCQKNDLVSMVGRFPQGKNVSLYRVGGSESENFLKAHARVYTGGERVEISQGDVEHEHGRVVRKLLTLSHFLSSFLMFPLVLLFHLVISAISLPFKALRSVFPRERLQT